MKKTILLLVAVFTAMGLYAGETTVEKLHDHYSAEANKTDSPLIKEVAKGLEENASKPTLRAKNLNEAVERWSNGKATDADKELIKSEDGPFIKELQAATVYGFQMDIDNPSYHFLAMGSASLPTVFSTVIDLYMIQHCTNDLSKITPDDFQNAGVSKEYGLLISMKYGGMWTTKDAYKKYIQAVRAYNCSDQKAFLDYIGIETVDATVLTKFDPKIEESQTIEFLFKNDVGNECKVYGKTLKYNNGKFSVNLIKQKCGAEQESTVEGYASPFKTNNDERADTTFTTLNVDDKVEIFKTK